MADYQYLGLTAYIKANKESAEKLNVLASAIDSLQHHVKSVQFDEEDYQNIIESDAFQFLYDHDYVCSPHDSELPTNTPEAYKRVLVEEVNIKGIPMIRLYVPAVAKSDDKIKHFMYNALHPVLIELFADDILSVRTKTQIEYKDFKDGEEAILTSAKDKMMVMA